MRTSDGLNKSILDLLLLSVLAEGDTYGYELTQKIRDYSQETLRITNGSMYPTLYKLEDQGYVTHYLVHGENRKERTYYHIENAGMQYLSDGIRQYLRTEYAIKQIMERGMASCEKMVAKRETIPECN